MAVEDSEAPGAHDEHSGAWKQDPDKMDRQRTIFAFKTGNDEVDQQRRREDAQQGREPRKLMRERRILRRRHALPLHPRSLARSFE